MVSKIDPRGGALHEEEDKDDGSGSPGKSTQEEGKEAEGSQGEEIKFALKVQYYGHAAHTLAFLKRDSYPVMDLKGDDTGDHVSRQL